MRLSAHKSDEDAYSLYGTDSALAQTYATIFLIQEEILQKEIHGDDDSEITKGNKDQIGERDSTDLLQSRRRRRGAR